MSDDLIDWSWYFREMGIVRGTIAEPPRENYIIWWNADGEDVEWWQFATEQEARDRLAPYVAATRGLVSLDAWRRL